MTTLYLSESIMSTCSRPITSHSIDVVITIVNGAILHSIDNMGGIRKGRPGITTGVFVFGLTTSLLDTPSREK